MTYVNIPFYFDNLCSKSSLVISIFCNSLCINEVKLVFSLIILYGKSLTTFSRNSSRFISSDSLPNSSGFAFSNINEKDLFESINFNFSFRLLYLKFSRHLSKCILAKDYLIVLRLKIFGTVSI